MQPDPPRRVLSIEFDALEDAFENNAPTVHSFLDLRNGRVVRIVEGTADAALLPSVSDDPLYVRVRPTSSAIQYRWMELFLPMVDSEEIRQKLTEALEGKGAFRRFKDVLMPHRKYRDLWFAYRAAEVRKDISAWLARIGVASAPDDPSVPESTVRLGGRSASESSLRDRLRRAVEELTFHELEAVLDFASFLTRRGVRTLADANATHETSA
jgi:hypothetical protein